MTAGGLVEATAAGDLSVLPEALLYGAGLGLLYDGFRLLQWCFGVRGLSLHSVRLSRMAEIQRKHLFAERQRKPSEPRRGVILFFLDLLYMLLCAVCSAVFFYWRSCGIFRWYLIACIGLGFRFYFRAADTRLLRLFAALLILLRAFLLLLYHGTLYPVLHLLLRICRAGACAGYKGFLKVRKGVFRGKKTGKTKEEGQLLHKNRIFCFHRVLRRHHLSDERADSVKKT